MNAAGERREVSGSPAPGSGPPESPTLSSGTPHSPTLDPPTLDPPAPDPLEPGKLGPLTLRNRIIKAATYEGLSHRGLVTDGLIDFHRAVAAGGVGMTTVAYCAVSPEGRTDRHQLLWREEALVGLRELTEAVHAEGAAVSAQIGHAGPVANPRSTRLPALAPSRRPQLQSLTMARAATVDELARITEDHAESAKMAVRAGFDAVEIHLGHNYLASSFLSPRVNRRRDSYGGSLHNRARFAREIARAVRAAVGGRIAILAKLNMDDGVSGGFWLDEAISVAQWLERDGSLDALELTAGSSLLNPMYLFKGDAPRDPEAEPYLAAAYIGYIRFATLAGALAIPALSVPFYGDGGEFPVGVELRGRRGEDDSVLRSGAAVSTVLG